MKVIHNIPKKEVIDLIERIGTVMGSPDDYERYFHLPIWFKKDSNGIITEVPINELPKYVKEYAQQESKIKSIAFQNWIIEEKYWHQHLYNKYYKMDDSWNPDENEEEYQSRLLTIEDLYTLWEQDQK